MASLRDAESAGRPLWPGLERPGYHQASLRDARAVRQIRPASR